MGRVGGAAVFLVALVGVCGPKRESKCLLRTHSIVLGDAWLGCSSARPTTRAQMRAIASWEIAACRRADLHAQVSSQGSASASPSTMTRGSSYVAQTDVYVHAEERVVTRNDGNLTRAHEAGEGIAICCMASQGHIVGGRTPQSMIKRYIFQLIVSAALGGGVYAAVRALLGSFSNCWCDENSDSICIATYTFDKTTWDACQQGIFDDTVCPECTDPVHGPWMPPGMCIPGQPVGISTYIDPVLTYLACWAVFGVWPTLFVLYKLLQ